MSETRQILEALIEHFSVETLNKYFRVKTRQYKPGGENYTHFDDPDFGNGTKLGEINFSDGDSLIVCSFKVKKELSERLGKKAQYEKAKSILRSAENQMFSAGIFVFHDPSGNFRFSLVYPESIGTRRQWNNFRRFTYFVSSELQVTNKTFKQRIGDGDFSSLEKIKDAFSVDKVTKEFYERISYWYFWAVKTTQFPKDAIAEDNGKNIAVIRLITRMIFIWFMRERGLVPRELFEKKSIDSILKSLDDEATTYYTGILQNLFFATLSTKKEERDFGSEARGHKGYNSDFGNQYVFRYQELFKSPEDLKKYFESIPFLNGGLFECLDDRPNGIIIDGFSRTKKNQPVVPNELFFSQEKKVDLNKDFDTKNKKYLVSGLLNILSSFNFTIDENSPDDAEVALDPELLGRVFENLLASFNPETSTTARKATGSYYTRREIVDYMVSESLKVYFKTHLEGIENLDEKLGVLFSVESQENLFNDQEKKKLVELVESVKIVDPAVGSGAFPMGVLNKLVFILNKVDRDNKLWEQAQLKSADAIPDQNLKAKTIKEIKEYFQTKKPDYWRKLYLIQRCIYGVDVQQIAVEIAKLRFFISLLVDEDKDDIQPLPNLDFKIMQGNSLLEEYEGVKLFDEKYLSQTSKQDIVAQISKIDLQLQENDSERLKYYQRNPNWMRKNNLEKPADLLVLENCRKALDARKMALATELKGFEKTKQQRELNLYEQLGAQSLSDELKRLHKEYFETNEKENKKKLRNQIDKMEWCLIEATLQEQNKTSELKKLEQFKKSKTKPFFLWKFHFAEVFENGGFDIVIANPPYIKEYTQKSAFDGLRKSPYYQGKMDLWYFFACKSIDLLRNNTGILSFIAQNNWVTSYGASVLRNKIMSDTQILHLVDFGDYKIFECAGIQTMVMIFQKDASNENYNFDFRRLIEQELQFEDVLAVLGKCQNNKTEYLEPNIIRTEMVNKPLTFSNSAVSPVLEKICSKQNIQLDCDTEVKQGIVYPQDYVNKASQTKLGGNYSIGDGIFVLSNSERERIPFTENERGLIKPSYTTKELFRWYGNPNNKEWVIYTDSSFKNVKKIEGYPNIKKHLDQFSKVITSDNKPYGLHRSRDERYFIGEKIIVARKCEEPTFSYVDFDSYVSATFYVIKTERMSLKYLVALLNSKLVVFWLRHKGKMQGNNFQIDKEPLINLPLVTVSESNQKPLIEIVDKILEITKSDDYLKNPQKQVQVKEYEKKIDQLVYSLYGLTDDEIKIVEGVGK